MIRHEIEESIIYAALADPSMAGIVSECTDEDCYTDIACKELYQAIHSLFRSGNPTDKINIKAELIRLHKGSDMTAFMLRAGGKATYTSNLKHLIAQLKDIIARDKLVGILSESMTDIEIGKPTAEIIDSLINNIGLCSTASDLSGLDDLDDDFLNTPVNGVTTGIDELDKIIGSLDDGELIILAARPSMGKTLVADHITMHILNAYEAAVISYSLEMGKASRVKRMISSIAKVWYSVINKNNGTDLQKHRILKAFTEMKEKWADKFFIQDKTSKLADIVSSVKYFTRKKKVCLVVVDYLGLIDGGDGNNANERIGDITKRLKHLAQQVASPVLLLCQLNRDVDKREGKVPVISDLRESGHIEQNADKIIFIHGNSLIVAKNRNGAVGEAKCIINKEFFTVENVVYKPISAEAYHERD